MAGPTTNAEIREAFEAGGRPETLGTGGLEEADGSESATPGFDTWREVDADRPALVTVAATAQTDGTDLGGIQLQIDEEGDGAQSFTPLSISGVPADLSDGAELPGTVTFYLPAGGQYQVQNASDPNDANAIDAVREVTL